MKYDSNNQDRPEIETRPTDYRTGDLNYGQWQAVVSMDPASGDDEEWKEPNGDLGVFLKSQSICFPNAISNST